ncbi:DHHC palmitoyltransferase-domain-containing protein [Mycena belliarum]|uniref:Palmitoyltransferase n=1 Tax=Mycena belliarum TaxID=1033014 RepID=A0AAD6U698_9AGAR|nr:DHHC palmitoyltransferase-domain-containing protein [Mycena belliae]
MASGNVAPPTDKDGIVALDKPTLCGTISEARFTARERREARARKPQPWVVRKLMVVVTLGIMGYTAYVYGGRFVLRLINSGRRREAVGLLVPWSFLYAWMVWAYAKVIITPPGNACDYTPKTPQPLFPRGQWEAETRQPQDPDTDSASASSDASLADIEAGRIGGPAYEELPATHIPGTSLPMPNGNGGPRPPPPRRKSSTRSRGDSESRPPPGRFPPTTAPLLPPHRWCSRCAIVKPYRAHHCRVCGTCILKFDHHCPWIGQCVGARNHKFFLNFALATAVFTLYTFGSLLAFSVMAGRGGGGNGDEDVDPQEVVVIALAALFALFTLSLGAAHTRLILRSQTTVESLGVQRMKERESAALAAAGMGCFDVGAKRRARIAYDKEWGVPEKEGNIWWAGSARAGWEDVMGRSVWGWIFPIGAPLGDGLHYRPNPRFDADGRWRRRSEWPEALR